VEEGELAVGGHVEHAAGTELPEWCIGGPKWAENS
jgi:hypothetical protein